MGELALFLHESRFENGSSDGGAEMKGPLLELISNHEAIATGSKRFCLIFVCLGHNEVSQ